MLRSPAKAATAAQTTTVTKGTVSATVSASGNAESATNLGISFGGCTGVLTSVKVQPGSTIKIGQVLATANTDNAAQAVSDARDSLNAAESSQAQSVQQAQTQYDNALASRELDLNQAQAAIDSAQKAYDSANAAQKSSAQQSLTQAKNQYASSKLKDDQNVASAQTSLTQAQSSSTQQAQAVTTAQQNLDDAKATLASCTLKSPVAGTVVTVNGTVGSSPGSGSVASSSSSSSSSSSNSSANSSSSNSSNSSSTSSAATVSPSSGFITVADLKKITVPASVSESDIGGVKVGDAASITFAALTSSNGAAQDGVTTNSSGTTVAGKVTHVDLTSTVSSSVVSYGVTVTLDAVPADLRLGQTASVTITTASKDNVLRLSTSAITSRGSTKTVTVVDGATRSVVEIETGITGNGMSEVTSGLTEGQVVEIPTTSSSTSSLLGGSGSLGGGLTRGGFGGPLGGAQ
jgi:multidrug efflux pump subunit AcrA (membrane-fusion protein)